jgi:hypothetical protein
VQYDAEIAATTRRLRAASTELVDAAAAVEALRRMTYLWAHSVRCGRVLDQRDVEEAVVRYLLEHEGSWGKRGPVEP